MMKAILMDTIKVLVIAEHDNHHVLPATYKALGAAHTMTSFGSVHIDILIAGYQCAEVAKALAQLTQVNAVFCVDDVSCKDQLAENITSLVVALAPQYTHVLTPATTTGKNLLPRVAALLDIQPLTDVIEIIEPNVFKRPIYAGSAIATVRCDEPIKLLSIRTSSFAAHEAVDGDAVEGESLVRTLPAAVFPALSQLIDQQLVAGERPELTAAKIVVSGGRGLQNGDNFQLIYQLADALKAAVGASRAAVDAGFVANDMQVGQTGKIVAPDLYIAVGISGAVQHLAGMKTSKTIVAINKDPDAPIFQVADYGLVADLFEVIPELLQRLGK